VRVGVRVNGKECIGEVEAVKHFGLSPTAGGSLDRWIAGSLDLRSGIPHRAENPECSFCFPMFSLHVGDILALADKSRPTECMQ